MAIPEPVSFVLSTAVTWPIGVTKLVVLVTKGGTKDADGSDRDWVRAFLVDVDTTSVKAIFDLYPEDDLAFLKALADAKGMPSLNTALTVVDQPALTLKGHVPDPPPKKSEMPTARMLSVAANAASAMGRMQVAVFDEP
jgi:hypothetical protein